MLNNYPNTQVTSKQNLFNTINISHAMQKTGSIEPNKQNTTLSQDQIEEKNIINEWNNNRYIRKMQNTMEDSSLL